MILIDNVNLFKKKYPKILDKIQLNSKNSLDLTVEKSKSGEPTLRIIQNNRDLYIHSKYNPVDEAEKFIEQFNADQYKHVMFYGFGFGYHVEAFTKKFPEIPFSIYEPNPDMFYLYLSHRRFNDLPLHLLHHIYLEYETNDMQSSLNHFVERIKDRVLLVKLPSYERVSGEKLKQFTETFGTKLSQKRANLITNFAYERRWTINSLMNFKYVMNTPDILKGQEEVFKNKPAILVAAGPSLEEDIEHIRYIKENGLAYIFSVGSAINALLSHGIYPDAACTYDPNAHNQKVFEQVTKEIATSIPLIFGSSVGFETLEKYPGPMLHMITSQDTISQFLLKRSSSENPNFVLDAPSIAIITLQLLHKLGCNPVVLAGQNLAFKDDQYYTKGIEYETRSAQISSAEKNNALLVEDVYGNTIQSNNSFNQMRVEMENLIALYVNKQHFINTTKGGANIKGTEFQPINEVISGILKERVVDSKWYEKITSDYDVHYLNEQTKHLHHHYNELKSVIAIIIRQLMDVRKAGKSGNIASLDKATQKFDKTFKKIQKNYFYDVFLRPLKRVQFELLLKNIEEIRFERDPIAKSEQIVKHFGQYISECKQDIDILEPLYTHMYESILNVVNERKTV